MSSGDWIAIAGFVVLFTMIGLRVPIGIAMGLVGVFGFAAVRGFGPALNLLASSPIRVITDFQLSLVTFFILMGVFATNSGMSRELFRAGNAWLGPFRGGLALATIAACAGFAAICGSSVATAATMSKVALPEMRRFGYPEDTASGVVAAGGTLGILIPPSIVLVVYGYITETDVGQLFVAGVIPGLLAVAMYMVTVRVAGRKTLPEGTKFSMREALLSLSGVWAVLLLFIAIMVAIYWGIATPEEASAVGALLTMIIGILRGRLGVKRIIESLVEALRTSVAVYTVLIGAILFGYFLAITQSPQKLTNLLIAFDLGPYGTLTLILILFVLAGCILDSMAMIILLVPIVFPVVVQLGFDPVWFGIIIVMTAELGLITPSVGINVFVINTVVKDIKLTTIFRGVMPFIFSDIIRLIILVAFPMIVMFLPMTMR